MTRGGDDPRHSPKPTSFDVPLAEWEIELLLEEDASRRRPPDDPGESGDREPRRPGPRAGSGAAALPEPLPDEPAQRMLDPLVDLLPERLWRSGNLFLGARLHFCYGRRSEHDERTVRVVEWNGRRVARGRRERRL